jgi:hypothetical protein
MRDDFPESVKTQLAKRVGYRCSRPDCQQATSGPSLSTPEAVNMGVAAHITGASPGGARYDPSLTPEQRKSYDNGIWLCKYCGDLVDKDAVTYPVELLRNWKATSERRAGMEVHRLPQIVQDKTPEQGGPRSIDLIRADEKLNALEKIKSEFLETVGTNRFENLYPKEGVVARETKYSVLDKDITHKMKAKARSNSVEGVQQVSAAARSIIADAKTRVDQQNRESDFLKMEFVKDPSKTLPDSLFILGPFLPYSESTTKPPRLSLRFFFRPHYTNSLEGTYLFIDIICLGSVRNDTSDVTLEEYELIPKFDREFNVYWESRDKTFNDGTTILNFAFDRFAETLTKEAGKAGSYRY